MRRKNSKTAMKRPKAQTKTLEPPIYSTAEMDAMVRIFDTGATRDADTDKLDFEGFLSPLAMRAFADYMHSHREQGDGSLRDSDNWQKGIPLESYMKSMWRHFFDVWSHWRNYGIVDRTALCGVLFNVQGMLHEDIKKEDNATGDIE